MWLNPIRRQWGPFLAALTLILAITLPSTPSGISQGTTADQQLDLIEQRTGRLRELDSKGTISHTFMRRENLRAHYEAMFFEENPVDEIEIAQRLLEVLGYIDPSVDIIQLYLNVLSEEVLGFYDRDDRSIYVISDREQLSPSDIVTLAHEFTHALQDEHFNLKKGFEDRKDNNDRTLAYQALAEGDAVLLQSLYSLRYLTDAERTGMYRSADVQSTAHAIETAPLILRRELYFPYEDGASFVVKHYLDNSWAGVNALWANPPDSTEQVLHPEKYLAGEKPVQVVLPDLTSAMGPGWRKLTDDTLGELDWQILIEQYVDLNTAKRAAAGWGGDRFQLFRRDSDGALAYETKTVWDTEQDAIEFFEAYQRVVEGRHGASLESIGPRSSFLTDPSKPAPDEAWGVRAGSWHHAIVRDGANVVAVTASDRGPLSVVDLLR
jgi:hypothetical protein